MFMQCSLYGNHIKSMPTSLPNLYMIVIVLFSVHVHPLLHIGLLKGIIRIAAWSSLDWSRSYLFPLISHSEDTINSSALVLTFLLSSKKLEVCGMRGQDIFSQAMLILTVVVIQKNTLSGMAVSHGDESRGQIQMMHLRFHLNRGWFSLSCLLVHQCPQWSLLGTKLKGNPAQ